MSLIKINSTFQQLTNSPHIGIVKQPHEQNGKLCVQYAPTFGAELAIVVGDCLINISSFTVRQELFQTATAQYTTDFPNSNQHTTPVMASEEFDFILYIRPQEKS